MKRTYLALVGLGIGALTLQGLPWPVASAQGLFSSQPLDGSRFVILGKPVGLADWSLLVLEQIRSRPLCWERRPDGLIDASLNRFDFTGICSRYIDSNGFSIRAGDQDLGSSYRLRLRQVGQEVQLQAMSPTQTATVLVGRGTLGRRDRDGFVAITLEPDWQLSRRVFGRQTLNHVYFATATPITQLIARAGRSVPSEFRSGRGNPQRLESMGRSRLSSGRAERAIPGAGPVALPVVPFRE
ncbi:DUF3747 domain-containing protein [Synechococcus sp. CS-1325]|uniref:DUF3747 domain-containing protein n=1 Tax=Synechococcus sp. CS-1325 TaxID=2847979 RepID=UPI000DB5F75E|nr:DUF3747 domain-containing protein [Synechococcus sp. CS-1325]MCT0200128.1 DUF3747 domain-containing protein [Synechococcus sp. CS-1325]PZU96934.1 MAG: hypothetical protein DCF24_13230 [Cyanobium sp.]